MTFIFWDYKTRIILLYYNIYYYNNIYYNIKVYIRFFKIKNLNVIIE